MRKVFVALSVLLLLSAGAAFGQGYPYTQAHLLSLNDSTQFPCGNAGSATNQIASSIANLPGGGTVDLSCYATPITITRDIFSTVTIPVTVMLPAVSVTVNANATIPANFTVCSRAGSSLAAGGGYTLTNNSSACNTISGAGNLLVDPGSNGILKRTAPNTTGIATSKDIGGPLTEYFADAYVTGSQTAGIQEAYNACQASLFSPTGCKIMYASDEAITAGGGTITIAAGKPVYIDLNGHTLTCTLAASGDCLLIDDDSNYNGTPAFIENGMILGSGSTTGVVGLHVKNTDYVHVKGMTFSGFSTSGSVGLELDAALVGSVEHNAFSHNYTNLLLTNGANVNTISDNGFSTSTNLAVNIQASGQVTLKTNDFEGNTGKYLIQVDATLGNIVNFLFTDANHTESNGDGTATSATFNFVTPVGAFIINSKIDGNFFDGQSAANGYAYNFSTTGYPNILMIRSNNYYIGYANADNNHPTGNSDYCLNENWAIGTGTAPVCDRIDNDHTAGAGSSIANFFQPAASTNPAHSGLFRTPYGNGVYSRNYANTADVPLLSLGDAGTIHNVLFLGSYGSSQVVLIPRPLFGADSGFIVTSTTGSNSTVYTFSTAYNSTPNCTATPNFDVGSGNRWWVGITTASLTIWTGTAVAGNWFVHCVGE